MRYLILVLLLPSLALAVPDAPTNLASANPEWTLDGRLPKYIYDDYIEGWVADAYLGNFVTRGWWYDGPQIEAGAMTNALFCVEALEGKTYCSSQDGGGLSRIIQVDDATGVARLWMDSYGTETGPTEEAYTGSIIWDDFNETMYLSGPGYCIRKVVSDGDGTYSVENFVGQCDTAGSADGTGAAATFNTMYGTAPDGLGNLWMIEDQGTSGKVRKITSAGVVTTETPPTRSGCNVLWQTLNNSRGLLSQGQDSNTFYIKDYYNTTCGHGVLKWDLVTNTLTKIIGIDPRSGGDQYGYYNDDYDGPALTHYSAKQGQQTATYNKFYESIFLRGQDSTIVKRYDINDPDGWVRTFFRARRPGVPYNPATLEEHNGLGMSVEQEFRPWSVVNYSSMLLSIGGYDSRGGIFGRGANPENSMIWRLYNTSLGGTQ